VAGNTVWDVLEKTPLVHASEDGSIAVSGTTGVIIYINDKKKVLSGFNKSGRPRTLVYPLVITLASAASSIKTVSNKVIS